MGVYEMSDRKLNFYVELQRMTLLEGDKHRVVPCYWFPLKKIKEEIPAIAFDSEVFQDSSKIEILKDIFKQYNVKKAMVVREYDDEYVENDFLSFIEEQDEDGYIFPYLSESFTYDESKEWMIYSSHEMTISFAGEWLVKEIRDKLLNKNDISNNYTMYNKD